MLIWLGFKVFLEDFYTGKISDLSLKSKDSTYNTENDIIETCVYFLTDQHFADNDPYVAKKVEAVKGFLDYRIKKTNLRWGR